MLVWVVFLFHAVILYIYIFKDELYLTPMIDKVVAERKEREQWDRM